MGKKTSGRCIDLTRNVQVKELNLKQKELH